MHLVTLFWSDLIVKSMLIAIIKINKDNTSQLRKL